MSHMSEVKLGVEDLDGLAEAAPHCGLRLVRDEERFNWYGRFMGDTRPPQGRDPKDYGKCEHKLVLQDARAGDYEIGVVKALDGRGYELMFDSWGPGARLVQACEGPNLEKLKQEYTFAVMRRRAEAKLRKHGFKAKREELDGGRLRLRLKRA